MSTKKETTRIDFLEEKIEGLEAQIERLLERFEKIKIRDRGPKSQRTMTEDDAKRILKGGDLEFETHKKTAKILGLSYGQIYSCRGGYTFRHLS